MRKYLNTQFIIFNNYVFVHTPNPTVSVGLSPTIAYANEAAGTTILRL